MSTWTWVGGQGNVHACPHGVGGWSKMVKILSTWFVNDPNVKCAQNTILGSNNKPILTSQISFEWIFHYFTLHIILAKRIWERLSQFSHTRTLAAWAVFPILNRGPEIKPCLLIFWFYNVLNAPEFMKCSQMVVNLHLIDGVYFRNCHLRSIL